MVNDNNTMYSATSIYTKGLRTPCILEDTRENSRCRSRADQTNHQLFWNSVPVDYKLCPVLHLSPEGTYMDYGKSLLNVGTDGLGNRLT